MQSTLNFAAGQPAPLTKRRGPKKKINAAPTQKRSYHEEVAFGRLKGRKAEILTMLKDGASVSCREAAMILGTFPNCLTAAFKQLEEAGVIAVVGEKADSTSNKTVFVYGLTA